MPKRIIIPKQVKKVVRLALEKRARLPKNKQAGLTRKEAEKLRIFSGVERAKQLLRNKFLNESDIRSMVGFYNRFKNNDSPKVELAMSLWGGRSFLRFLRKIYKYSK